MQYRKILMPLLLISSLIVKQSAQAQTFFSRTEYGVSLGAAQYFGDLNENYGLKYVRPAGNFFVRVALNPYIGIKVGAGYTKVGYDDQFSNNVYNKTRNLNFRSDIVEASLQAEFNFFGFITGESKRRFTPYLTGGVGAFYYNPYTIYQGQRVNLRRLGTEGQNAGFDDRKYSNISMCFPVGVGFKYWLRPGVNFGMEISNRLTLTDYMDDVSTTYVGAQYFPNNPRNPNPAYALQDRSIEVTNNPLGRAGKQRGNSATKDQYMMVVFNLSFQLKVYKCPSYLKDQFSLQ